MATQKTKKYIEAMGRRKEASARVRITPSDTTRYIINDTRTLEDYFPTEELRVQARRAFSEDNRGTYVVSAHLRGGGIHAQAQALAHGISRALSFLHPPLRKGLKSEGLLVRDSRAKERRKFGLKKARKSPQWRKR